MADIIPFRGVYFEPKKIAQLEKVTCPPYDVISPQEQEYFYHLHPYNVIRLVLGKNQSTDTKVNNRNTRAAQYFQTWLKKGILKKEDQPSLYVYQQKYAYENRVITPLGFIALSRLEEWRERKILPHEVIFGKFKLDRLELLRATKANFESILALYPHSARIEKILKKASKTPPFLKLVDEQKVEHAIYHLSNPREISLLQKEMRKRPLFIADGHHRYQAALDFSKEVARRNLSRQYKTARFVMVTFMDMEKSHLTIFPTHRLIFNLATFSSSQIFALLAPYFQVKKVSFRNFLLQLKKEGKKGTVFGLYLGKNRNYIIKFKGSQDLSSLLKENKSLDWKKLDVTILHKLILEKLFCLGKKNVDLENHIFYTRDPKEAQQKVDRGQAQLAFFLNPTRIKDIQAVASRGERMPPKSTYFYPKMRSGLIMREMDN